MRAAVIGAGLGGLSAACLLAKRGHHVTVYEKNGRPGGKINEVSANGFRFDTGPSLLTMPFLLRSLFRRCGVRMSDYLQLKPLDPLCRYRYPDGMVFDSYQDRKQTLDQLSDLAHEDYQSYTRFLKYCEGIYDKTADAFLFNPLYSFRDLRDLSFSDFWKIDALETVSERVDDYFSTPYMRTFFKRFTTYNGSSPFQAPATLNVIPHVELELGGFFVEGGMYRIIEALVAVGSSMGVHYQYEAPVKRLITTGNRVSGIQLEKGPEVDYDLVVSNSDAYETYLQMLPEQHRTLMKRKQVEKTEPSCSGFVLLLGCNRSFDHLSHHNVFFSNNYRMEFTRIFQELLPPDDPTIYIANTAHSDPSHAPAGGSNLFVLVNVPYLSDRFDWEQQKEKYAEMVIGKLEERGLQGLSESIVYRDMITPADFYQRYRSNRGSIYGTSSNSRLSAFVRPRNKARAVEGLYLVGGSTHPGGGIPLVILSAMHAEKLIKRYEPSY